MTRNRWMIALAAAFLVGCTTGVLGGIVFARFILLPHRAAFADGPRFDGPHRGPNGEFAPPGGPGGPAGPGGPGGPGGPAGGGPERHLERLSHVLDLNDEQRERMRGHMERSRGEFDGVRDSLEARIARELTPAQRERWKQMQREFPGRGARRGPWPRPDRAGPGDEGEPR